MAFIFSLSPSSFCGGKSYTLRRPAEKENGLGGPRAAENSCTALNSSHVPVDLFHCKGVRGAGMYLKQTLARCSVVADESKAILHQSSDVPPFFLLLLSFCPYFHFMLFYSHISGEILIFSVSLFFSISYLICYF